MPRRAVETIRWLHSLELAAEGTCVRDLESDNLRCSAQRTLHDAGCQ